MSRHGQCSDSEQLGGGPNEHTYKESLTDGSRLIHMSEAIWPL